jgi:head-tail adaptor
MFAGKLDRLVTIEQRVVVRDPQLGSEVPTWTTFAANVWASKEEFTNVGASEEYMRPGGIETNGAISRIKTRYVAGVNTAMRLNLGSGQLRQITGLAELGRQEGLQFSCKEWSHE